LPSRAQFHQSLGIVPRVEQRRRYDLARVNEHSRWYGRRWQKLRNAYLALHPLCECGCGYAAEVVPIRHRTGAMNDCFTPGTTCKRWPSNAMIGSLLQKAAASESRCDTRYGGQKLKFAWREDRAPIDFLR
jgi:hypothetical protein